MSLVHLLGGWGCVNERMGKAPVCSQEVHTYPSAFRYCTMHAAHITPCHSPQPWFAPWSITPQHLARSVLFLFWVTSHFRQREVWVLCKTFSKVVWPAGFWSSSRQLCCFCVLEGVGVLTLVCSLRDSIRVAAAHVEWVGVCKTTALEMNIPRKWKKNVCMICQPAPVWHHLKHTNLNQTSHLLSLDHISSVEMISTVQITCVRAYLYLCLLKIHFKHCQTFILWTL